MNRDEFKDKVAGAVYGFMIGDSMGATTEFMSRDDIESIYPDGIHNIIGGGAFGWDAGECTDDTQMSWCIMKVLTDCQSILHLDSLHFKFMVADEFAKWYDSKPKDVGKACANGIAYYKKMHGFLSDNDDILGNGALMRAMPCALVDRDDLNMSQADITHPNDTNRRIILEYSKLLQNYIMGNYSSNESKCLRSSLVNSQGYSEPTGYVIDTITNAIYWSDKPTFMECIIGAVNDGGDADTIAAIAGSLSGARFGLKQIPCKWVGQLKPEWKSRAGKFINMVKSYATNSYFDVYNDVAKVYNI